MRRHALALASLCITLAAAAPALRAQPRIPTVDDLLSLESAGGSQLSPDGAWVAYTVTTTDWKADAFVGQLWVVNVASGERRQLTRHPKGISGVQWSPDGTWISFISSRDEDKPQLFVMRLDGGEPLRLTKAESGVGSYQWSPR
ncbi:MAG: PD40 domain-containing protein, partial [Gemmatimonadaceae bacterium]|nr:PD40 domain-containing protein [Gemmatimonadaceae bacterium]